MQKKTEEARIPIFPPWPITARPPQLGQYTALSRFAHAQDDTRETPRARMSRTAALVEKIGKFDPKVHKIDGPKELQ